MFLFGNKFYIVFISIWIIGLYFIFSTFHSPSSTVDRLSEERIELLQKEVDTLREKIQQIQSGKNFPEPSAKYKQKSNDTFIFIVLLSVEILNVKRFVMNLSVSKENWNVKLMGKQVDLNVR